MKQGTTETFKFKKLKRRLRMPEWQVTGILESVWRLTATSTPEGDIGRLSNEDIAASIEYDEDPDELVGHLVECGWLDEHTEHRLVVHDWSDHAPNFVKGNVRRHGKKFANESVAEPPKEHPPSSSDPPKEPPREAPTQSSLVKPSQAQSSPAAASAACAAEAAADLEFFDRTRKAANRLRKAKPSLDREWVWKACATLENLAAGLSSDIVERIGTSRIDDPRRYIEGVIRRECESRDVKDWRRMLDLAPPVPPPPEEVAAT